MEFLISDTFSASLARLTGTGAAQLVEIRERVEVAVEGRPRPSAPLFAQTSEEALLSYGVPPAEWLPDVRQG